MGKRKTPFKKSDSYQSFCTRSYQIQISFKQIYLTLTDTITPGQSEPRSNGNEGIQHTTQISKTGASPSNAV